MNNELNARWQQSVSPFDGPVLFAAELTASQLLSTVRLTLSILHAAHGTKHLFVNDDWHDHDGLIKPERIVPWTDAMSWTQDAERLRQSCANDSYVHTLLFPEDFAFCLRYRLDDDGECSFDLSAGRGTLEKLVSCLGADGVALRIESSSKGYFDRQWGG